MLLERSLGTERAIELLRILDAVLKRVLITACKADCTLRIDVHPPAAALSIRLFAKHPLEFQAYRSASRSLPRRNLSRRYWLSPRLGRNGVTLSLLLRRN